MGNVYKLMLWYHGKADSEVVVFGSEAEARAFLADPPTEMLRARGVARWTVWYHPPHQTLGSGGIN